MNIKSQTNILSKNSGKKLPDNKHSASNIILKAIHKKNMKKPLHDSKYKFQTQKHFRITNFLVIFGLFTLGVFKASQNSLQHIFQKVKH